MGPLCTELEIFHQFGKFCNSVRLQCLETCLKGLVESSLFVLLYFFFWPLCCLFFDIHILIAPLVSSNSSCHIMNYSNYLSMFISLQHDEGPPMFDSEQQFIFLRLNILREYLEKELLITNIPFEYDFEVNFSA